MVYLFIKFSVILVILCVWKGVWFGILEIIIFVYMKWKEKFFLIFFLISVYDVILLVLKCKLFFKWGLIVI